MNFIKVISFSNKKVNQNSKNENELVLKITATTNKTFIQITNLSTHQKNKVNISWFKVGVRILI